MPQLGLEAMGGAATKVYLVERVIVVRELRCAVVVHKQSAGQQPKWAIVMREQ